MSEREPFAQWAVLELMGHRRLAGFVSEETIAGGAFIRIDIPKPDAEDGAAATQLYTPGAVYCITPTTEEIARAVARRAQPAPVTVWELTPPSSTDDDEVPF